MVGATYHQIGKPTKTVSYSDILPSFSAISGREDKSFISSVERLFLFVQSRSSQVYGLAGLISNKSAFATFASFSAIFFVTPLAEKYATRVYYISTFVFSFFIIIYPFSQNVKYLFRLTKYYKKEYLNTITLNNVRKRRLFNNRRTLKKAAPGKFYSPLALRKLNYRQLTSSPP